MRHTSLFSFLGLSSHLVSQTRKMQKETYMIALIIALMKIDMHTSSRIICRKGALLLGIPPP